MGDFARIHDGDGFEAAVRVLAHSAGTLRRCKFRRARIVEQQERTQLLPQFVITEKAAHRKTVAYPVPGWACKRTA